MAMKKVFAIIMIVLFAFIAINIIRDGSDYPLPQVLPFCSGEDVNMFDLGAVLLLLMAFMGIWNVCSNDEDDE